MSHEIQSDQSPQLLSKSNADDEFAPRTLSPDDFETIESNKANELSEDNAIIKQNSQRQSEIIRVDNLAEALKEDVATKKNNVLRPIKSNPLSLDDSKYNIPFDSNNDILSKNLSFLIPGLDFSSGQPSINPDLSRHLSSSDEKPSDQNIDENPKSNSNDLRLEYLPLDISSECQKGNFLPALYLLKENLMPKDYLDSTGYGILHQAISSNQIEIVLILLEIIKIDINMLSKSLQTPLMIACNNKSYECIKILIDRGASIDLQDQTKFTAFLYSVKQHSLPALVYLLYKRCDFNLTDLNGCSAIHWAAYKNNLYLLRFLKRLQFNLWNKDMSNQNCLERAIQSDSLEVCKYLINESGETYPIQYKFEEINNLGIRELFRRKYKKTYIENIIDLIKSIYAKHSRAITLTIYIFIWIMTIYLYYEGIKKNNFDYVYHIVYIIFCLYNLIYTIWYFGASSTSSLAKYSTTNKIIIKNKYTRIEGDIGNVQHNDHDNDLNTLVNNESVDINIIKNMNFNALDKLTNYNHEGIVISEQQDNYKFPTFLHQLVYNFEANNFKAINLFDYRDYCPTCLLKKPLRSKHCSICNQCIEHYYFHSYTLGKCINNRTHIFYMLYLVQLTLFMILTVIPITIMHSQDRNSMFFLISLETAWWIGIKEGIICGLWYLVATVILLYSACFVMIELYGISVNLTYNEIFNGLRYKYLFRLILTPNGHAINVYKNPFNKGFFKNWCEYATKIFN